MQNPFVVMSAITGKPTKQEIAAYLEQLKENGIEQFMVYPRSGCGLEYLSEEWFDTIGYFVKSAQSLHMKMWLYDEFNWPSGDAGGKVTGKGYRLRGIKLTGKDKGRISFDSMHNSELFGIKLFPDLLSHEAMDYFVECTHEKYYEHFGEYFGNVIVGMFTDEPSINYACGKEDVPYYDGMEEDYAGRCGRDFQADLRYEDPEREREMARICLELASERFRECFVKKSSNWCREHGLMLTGHMVADDAIFGSTRYNGDLLAAQQEFMLPGVDEIWTELENPQLLTLFGSVEYVRSKRKMQSEPGQEDPGAMAELFALGPCDMSYAKKRCMLYFASCFKINHYFLAISPLDMRGNAKIKDYFNCFTAAQPDFAGMKLLAEEGKAAATMAEWDFKPDVLVRYPVSLCAKHILEDSKSAVFIELAKALSFYQLQWRYLAEGESADDMCRAGGEETPVLVIDFTDDFSYKLDGFVTDDPRVICEKLLERCGNKLFATDIEGRPVRGLFVRKYDNGESVVLNLSAPAGSYLVDGKEVFLDQYAVCRIPGTDYAGLAAAGNGSRIQALTDLFTVTYGNPNLIRTMYLNEQKIAEVECACENGVEVIFSIREGVNAALGEKSLTNLVPDERMPVGFARFYGMTEPYHLEKGLYLVSAEEDLKYFPGVVVSGAFAAETISGEVCRIVLRDRKMLYVPGEFFADYGKVVFTAKVAVPREAKAIVLTGTTLYTKVSADGMLLGERICGPYTYPVTAEMQGREVVLEIEQFSSLGPVFGDTAYYDTHSEKVGWKGTPPTGKSLFGFEKLEWIL